jgi:hypothetical protein
MNISTIPVVKITLVLLLALFLEAPIMAEIHLPEIISDNKVFQCEIPVNIPNPVAVKYAWADNPDYAYLYNKELCCLLYLS